MSDDDISTAGRSFNQMPPPLGDGWFLAYVPGVSGTRHAPWIIATRCDSGFCDEHGYSVDVEGWVPLPDPQPRPTGWSAPAGTILVEHAKIVETDDQVWLASFVLPDGKYDEAREPYFNHDRELTVQWAQEAAAPWALPIKFCQSLADNVVPFARAQADRDL